MFVTDRGLITDQERPALELWAGAECSVVRVGDDLRDQAEETGHRDRPGDMDLFHAIGARRVRFPILWEQVAPESLEQLDFRWPDRHLGRLRALGIPVIAGLLHHGSGPAYASLLDPDFPAKLANYAARVAERYPWIDMWTPVNEPLTTARFAGLYGHWHPHGRDYATFLRALINECLGTIEAMRAIRSINPAAQLVVPEDLGKTFATEPLHYQAAHENERRWLSLDLLCGRVDDRHPMMPDLAAAGISQSELDRFRQDPVPPGIIGVNHYLTSERFLDHRVHLYPDWPAGGNGRDAYVDGEAVRVEQHCGDVGVAPRVRECWRRYGLPIALTEVHHGCNRAEQLRWFVECWRSAQQLRGEGVDLRAVTLWSMFGNVDWRFLLTKRRGLYDPGAYDVRSPKPRPTAVALAAQALAAGRPYDHPALDSSGWWRRPTRLYAWNGGAPAPEVGRTLLITGATGTLGMAMARLCEEHALPFRFTARDELDLCKPASIAAALARHRPWAVINAAGFVRVADAERERDTCFAWNAEGPEHLARACAEAGLPLVTFSSDLVFDGSRGRPYDEDDPVSPASVYGASKAEAERRVAAAHPGALIVRTAAFFSPWDRFNFAWQVLDSVSNGRAFRASRSSLVSPTYVPDLCHAVLDLLVDGESGLWHLANAGRLSWHDLAVRLALAAGYAPELIEAEDGPAADTSLISRRGTQLRPLDGAIDDFVGAVQGQFMPPPDPARPRRRLPQEETSDRSASRHARGGSFICR